MRKPTGPTNPIILETAKLLKHYGNKYNRPAWKDLAKRILSPRRKRCEVNLWKLEKYCKDGEIVVIPGKVLGVGDLTKKLIVGALAFSKSAKEKIIRAGGEALTLKELLMKYPEGKGVKIMR
jgi:large subunit ribosomal protein L18e